MEPMDDASTMEKQLLARASAQRIPMNGSVELLPLCNMSCDMCYVRMSREEMEHKGRIRSVEEWTEIGTQMQKAGVLFLLLTGGEPLLYPGFKELYQIYKKMGFILTINTNGTLIDEAWADFFAQFKPRRINITLYGASRETYERLCHNPDGFDRTIRALHLLKERNVDVRMSLSIVPANVDDVDEMRRIAEELDIPVLLDGYMLPATRERDLPFNMQSRLSPEEAAALRFHHMQHISAPEDFAQYAASTLYTIKYYRANENSAKITCYSGKCSFAINWQGYMRPCVILSEPSPSVFTDGVEGCWRQTVKHCEDLRISQKCAECHLRPICRTCPASALIETGSYTDVPEYCCKYAEEFERLLNSVVTLAD